MPQSATSIIWYVHAPRSAIDVMRHYLYTRHCEARGTDQNCQCLIVPRRLDIDVTARCGSRPVKSSCIAAFRPMVRCVLRIISSRCNRPSWEAYQSMTCKRVSSLCCTMHRMSNAAGRVIRAFPCPGWQGIYFSAGPGWEKIRLMAGRLWRGPLSPTCLPVGILTVLRF